MKKKKMIKLQNILSLQKQNQTKKIAIQMNKYQLVERQLMAPDNNVLLFFLQFAALTDFKRQGKCRVFYNAIR